MSNRGSPTAVPIADNSNFVATDGIERTTSIDTFADIVPQDFVSAVAHLGPEHLVEAMNEAVRGTDISNNRSSGNNSSSATQQQSRSQSYIVQNQQQQQRPPATLMHDQQYQTQQQQQQQQFSPIFFPSPQQQSQMLQHHAPAAPGFVALEAVSSRSPSAVSSHSTALLPTPFNEAATTRSGTPVVGGEGEHATTTTTAAAGGGGGGGGPVVAQLKRVHRRREELRSTAFVEGQDRAIVAVPPRTPGRTSNSYPATPAYWANRGGAASGGGEQEESWQTQTMKRRGLTTPAVPRPDLSEDYDAEEEKVRMRRLGGRSPSEVQAVEMQKRYEMSEEALRRTELKRRAHALSEHYKREFSSSCNVRGTPGGGRDGLVHSDNDEHNDDEDDEDENIPPRPGAVLRPPVPAQPLTPGERVFKSRAVRMAASDHRIIAASPEAKAEYTRTPRVRSPYATLLDATEVDHFKHAPPPPPAPAVSLRATEAIDRALKEGSLDIAHRSLSRVDRKTGATHVSFQQQQPPPYEIPHHTTPSRRQPGLVIGAQPVSVPLMDNQHDAYHPSVGYTGTDDMSSPQATALLQRLLQQKASAEHEANASHVDTSNRRAFLSAQ